MDATDIQKLAELLRHSDLEYVHQALELSVVLPLFEWTSDRLLQPSALLTDVFEDGEIQWLKIAWFGHFLTTVQDSSLYDVAAILGAEHGQLIVENGLPILPNCWQVFQVEDSFELVLKVYRIRELPLSLAESSAISHICWTEGGCEIPEALWDLDIVWAQLDREQLNFDRLNDWIPSEHIVEFMDLKSEWQWVNWDMMDKYWTYSNLFNVSYGSGGDCEQIYRLGTQSFLRLSADFLTVPSMGPPSFTSASVEYFEGSVRDYLFRHLRDFKIGAKDIPYYPHRVDELTPLLPQPHRINQHVEDILISGPEAKEAYRQEILDKLSALEQSIQTVKQQWRQW